MSKKYLISQTTKVERQKIANDALGISTLDAQERLLKRCYWCRNKRFKNIRYMAFSYEEFYIFLIRKFQNNSSISEVCGI